MTENEARELSDKEKCEFFSPPNALKAKVGGLEMLDPTVLAAAEAKLAELRGAYHGWVEADLGKLAAALRKFKDAPETAADQLAIIEGTAHEIKGQAGTFDYPLLTQIAESLCDMLRGADAITARRIELVEAHIEAIGVVVRGRIQGDGGEIGTELLSRLRTAVRKTAT
jgi:HPt (histidine-containing phosphotransfer) domain-containing protein